MFVLFPGGFFFFCFFSRIQWLPLIGDKERHLSSFGFSLSNSTYLCPFIVVLDGINYIPLAPWHDVASQSKWFGGCFIMATSFSYQDASSLARYYLLHGSLVGKQHFLPPTESPMARTCDKVQSLFLHHWCQVWPSCRPVGR